MYKKKDVILTGFALFAMLFGAGNLIFPPVVGFTNGDNWIVSAIGFILTGAGFPLLAIIAAAVAGKDLDSFATRVSPLFSKVFNIALILSIGIGIQNFPEGTAISLPLHESGLSRFKAMMYGQFSALVEIPSALFGFLLAQVFSSILPFALSFAAGAMMFVCIEELIPEANSLTEIDVCTMSVMVGFMIMMMFDVLLC